MSWKTILLTRKIFMYLPTEESALVIKGFMTRGSQWQPPVKSSSRRNFQQNTIFDFIFVSIQSDIRGKAKIYA